MTRIKSLKDLKNLNVLIPLDFQGLQLNAYQKWFNAYQNAYLKKDACQIFGKHEK